MHSSMLRWVIMHISMLRWCINNALSTINVVKKKNYKCAFLCQNINHSFIIKVISCLNISACFFPKVCFMVEYRCMHVFSKAKCIFKYKCMHVYARGYGTQIRTTRLVSMKTYFHTVHIQERNDNFVGFLTHFK